MDASNFDDFIWEHRLDDPARLALSGSKYPGIPIREAAAQVAALQKIRNKVPSWYRPGLRCPNPLSVEQASSEAVARYKSSLFGGERFVDLTGGLGVDAFFLAQSFREGIYCEKQTDLAEAVRQNYAVLGVRNIEVRSGNSLPLPVDLKADLIYLDPARRHDAKGRVFLLEDCTPNILEHLENLLEHAPVVALKTAPMLDIRLAVRRLGLVSRIYVIAHDGECREVLYLLSKDAPPEENIPVSAVRLKGSEPPLIFDFSFEEEKITPSEYALPERYLYEPNAALLKAGAFRCFGARFGLRKLHPDTHLYTSEKYVAEAPARVFEVQFTCKYDKNAVAEKLPGKKAGIAVRNFPESAETVRKKLGLSDGGDWHLFACTDLTGGKMIIAGKPV